MLRVASASLLSRYEHNLSYDQQTLETTTDLVAAAYLFCQERYFTIFTRRMILDCTESFFSLSECERAQILGHTLLSKCDDTIFLNVSR